MSSDAFLWCSPQIADYEHSENKLVRMAKETSLIRRQSKAVLGIPTCLS